MYGESCGSVAPAEGTQAATSSQSARRRVIGGVVMSVMELDGARVFGCFAAMKNLIMARRGAFAGVVGMGGRRSALLAVLLCGLLWSAPAPLGAEVFPYLYHGVVTGDNRQPTPGEISKALEQVLVRLTGIEDLAKDERLARLLDESTQVVSEFEPLPPDVWGRPRFRIGFHQEALEQHLKRTGLSIWTSNHPRLLIFVVQADGAYPARVLTTGGGGEEADRLRSVVQELTYRRGLLMALPINDYAELSKSVAAVLKGQYRAATNYLRERYQMDAVVLIHLEKLGTANWYAESRFLGDIEGKLPTGDQSDVVHILTAAIERVGNYYWSLNAHKPRVSKGLKLVVEDVHSYIDLARLTRLLAGALPAGQSPTLLRMSAGNMEFNFQTRFPLFRVRQFLQNQTGLQLLRNRRVAGGASQLRARLLPALEPGVGEGLGSEVDVDLEADADLERADADLENADADLENADADLENADADLERADADLENADADLERADANSELQP